MTDAVPIAINRSARSPRVALLAVLSLVLLVGALSVDGQVAIWIRRSGLESFVLAHYEIKEIIKVPGVFWATCAWALLIGMFHRLHWRGAAFVVASGTIATFNTILKWCVGRLRPYKFTELGLTRYSDAPQPYRLLPFRGGFFGQLDQRDLTFTSGHACVAFATAAALAILLPRWRWPLFAGATLVAAERLAENAHYLGDVVGAMLLALWGVWALHRALGPWLLDEPELPVH
jgi:membrane-associated phospholipid phosphatase